MINEDNLERELSCGICLELYTDPLQLSCMHTFCSGCLNDILKSGKTKKLKCPDCRKTSDLGKNGLSALKRNFKLGSIVDIYRRTLQNQKEKEEPREHKRPWTKDRCPSPPPDYAFLNDVIYGTHEDLSVPFEPYILDDIWGTFRRTSRIANRRSVPPPRDSPPSPPPRLSRQDPDPSLSPRSGAKHISSGVSPCTSAAAIPPGVSTQRLRRVPPPITPSPSTTCTESRVEPSAPPLLLQDPLHPTSTSDKSCDSLRGLSQHPVCQFADLFEGLNESDCGAAGRSFDIASAMSAVPPLPPRTTNQQRAPALPPRDKH